jgi:hypothetical protein
MAEKTVVHPVPQSKSPAPKEPPKPKTTVMDWIRARQPATLKALAVARENQATAALAEVDDKPTKRLGSAPVVPISLKY